MTTPINHIRSPLHSCRTRNYEQAMSQEDKPVAAQEPVHQWRRVGGDGRWRDASYEEAYSRVDADYEARTLYANAAPCARCKELEAQVKDWKRGANAEAREVDAAHAKITEQAARIKALEAEAADRESFLKTLADTCTEAERIAIERAGRIDAMEAECRKLRARLEKAEPIVAAARNLIEQKGRHNTEIAYKRLADAIAKERTA